MRFRLL